MTIFLKGNKRILHVHIPKTAGTSVGKTFSVNGWLMSMFDSAERDYLKCSPQHLHPEALSQIIMFDKFDYIFNIFRNPLERIISEYKYEIKFHNNLLDISFDDWWRKTLAKYHENPYLSDNHIRPQVEFATDFINTFPYEMGLLKIFDNIGYATGEKFTLSDNIKIHNTKDVKVEIKDKETIKSIEDFYADDIEVHCKLIEKYKDEIKAKETLYNHASMICDTSPLDAKFLYMLMKNKAKYFKNGLKLKATALMGALVVNIPSFMDNLSLLNYDQL